MAGKMDRRAARTQKALHNALMALILSKGYEATTVQDIIDEADVGRSTFYSHYTGKEDLLRSGFQTLRADLAEAQHAAAAKGEGARDELLGFSLAMFEHADQYKQIYRALVGARGGVIAVAEIRRVLSEIVKKELSDVEDDEAVPKEVRIQFVVGAFLTTLTWWLEQRPRLTPSQVNLMFRHLVLNGIDRSNCTASGQG
ncbi:TetR/AcrR family transcriptional regulator [Chelativorans salis]|uniref:TetR/AcrR family transcriptional regulator n=1 Tax=Chelativorans salis TaxID=2978478 RepID=A0ABT2LRB6_9HYPH|nr:TetR/AcrR family transcriptional regulator [Chelativorans sp. EGI FJ00035]MCT7376634.1 TetR/AcrR family transcriptional regulator [Chelativorans sp. EGI FJ00035]